MARLIYTEEQIAYVREIAPGTFNREIAALFNERFDTNITAKKITALKRNHNITSGTRGKGPGKNPPNKIFTDEIVAFINQHYKGISNTGLTKMINKQFGLSLETDQVKNYKNRNGLDSGLKGYFEKGQPPVNKGKKQTEYMSQEAIERTKATRFQKGQPPINYRPVGSERYDKDGYIMVKVQEKGRHQDRWRLKHSVVWEKANGPVPSGYVLMFLDQDKTNCTIDNLRLISRSDLVRINQNGLLTNEPSLNEVAITVGKMLTKMRELQKK